MSAKTKTVFVIYYSMYGHIEEMARHLIIGLEKSGVRAKLFQIQETLPSEVLKKMNAPEKRSDVPILTPDLLPEADGILLGMPTRFGMVPAQVKTLFDSCGQLWFHKKLINKPYGFFFSTSSLGGGQETTALTSIPFFSHLGMIFVPLGGKCDKLGDVSQVHGGSAYGSGTIADHDNKRRPSKLELEIAEFQGFDFGNVVLKKN